MMKFIAGLCVVMVLLTLCPVASQAAANREPGGVVAFFIGCCFGLRVGTEWNEGADLHWREWGVVIPVAGYIIGIWNGIECFQGIGAHEWAEANGANWY